MKQFTIIAAILLAAFTQAQAQIKTPQPSPTAKISQEVGLGKIDIEYSRPGAKGRKIYGDLVPFGDLWRTGANSSTKITLSDDAKVNGVPLAKGTYALYTIPTPASWTIIFYKDISLWGAPEPDKFKEDDVAIKVTATPKPLAEAVETFTIEFNNIKNNGTDIELIWENTKVAFSVVFDVDAKVMADIKTQMDGPSATSYYQAARYYYEEKKDMNQALSWIDQALAKGGDKFWILRVKANILAELGRFKDAIAVAEKSTELAKKEGNADYPRMNEKSIGEWKKK